MNDKVKLIKMVQGETGKQANVHPDEVNNYRKGGYFVAAEIAQMVQDDEPEAPEAPAAPEVPAGAIVLDELTKPKLIEFAAKHEIAINERDNKQVIYDVVAAAVAEKGIAGVVVEAEAETDAE